MFWKKRQSNFHAFKVTSSSFLLVLLFAAVFVSIILIGPRPYKGVLQAGNIARRTIKAPFDFYVQGDINPEATSRNADEAIKEIHEVLKDFIHEYIKDGAELPLEDLAVTNIRVAV